jgi:hypothetical protein
MSNAWPMTATPLERTLKLPWAQLPARKPRSHLRLRAGSSADCEELFRAKEVNKRMKDKAAHACHALFRARLFEEMRLRKGTATAEHLKVVLGVYRRAAFPLKGRRADDTMAEPLESNSLELRIAFHNAVSRFQDWTTNVAEPKVKLLGRFCPISEVCEQVANLSNLLPEFILSVLYKETKAADDVLALKSDNTYRGAGRHLLRLIERRKDEIRRQKTLKS